MKIVIAGASGLIGKALVAKLKGHELIALNRDGRPQPGTSVVVWDGQPGGEWTRSIEGADAVVNLAGSPISVKWTDENRRQIVGSRLHSTRAIGSAIEACDHPPAVWINGSAIGYYGDTEDKEVDELSPPGSGFLAATCVAWEDAVLAAATPTTRKVLLRTGIVLAKDGGALEPLAKLARFGLGGAAGKGRQFMPWIHIEDHVSMIDWLLREPIEGPVNATAPRPVTNAEFMATLREVVRRPWSPPVPAAALGLVGRLTGPDPALLLDSSRVLPRVALSKGFGWRYFELHDALEALLRG